MAEKREIRVAETLVEAAKANAVVSRFAFDEEFGEALAKALSAGQGDEAAKLLADQAGVEEVNLHHATSGRSKTVGIQFPLRWQICVTITVCYP